ncbi:MAG: GAF domain-containing SpoIIE family protein phosphatase, partial [Lentisphaeria bacterium]
GNGLLEVSSVMVVPMIMEDSLVGIICAVNSQVPGYNFSDNDLRLLNSLAQQASFAYEFLKIYQKLSDQQRIGKELEVARHIQGSLLPSSIPSVGEYRFIPFSSPAKEVGGDYYDFIKIDDCRNLVVVADASGKGVPAGMIMTICRTALRAFAKNFTSLNDLLVMLNSILYDDTDGSHFITMIACIINHQTNEVEFARAGHTAFLTMKDSEVLTYDPDGCALGLLPPQIASSFEVGKLVCEKNQSILLFSDGITEAVDRNNEEFGVTRLCDAWRNAMRNPDRSSLPISIVEAVDNFTEYALPSDDRTLVLIERV